ncbi:MAG: hypothetical protein KJ985_05960 [Proteobacteria bacterium]|nr:hypothetical protein [Pseudomonadota bacterium]
MVVVSDKGEETKVIESKVEKQSAQSAGEPSTSPYESHMVPADDILQRKFTDQLNSYYDEVISLIRNAEAILIFGPGEAKGELKKRLERDKLDGLIEAVETVDDMTDRQIAAKVRGYFQK